MAKKKEVNFKVAAIGEPDISTLTDSERHTFFETLFWQYY